MLLLIRTVNHLLITTIIAIAGLAQPSNDGCNSAEPICPNTLISGSNFGATSTVCPDCEDDFMFCFAGTNTVWYRFTTNASGGDVTVNFSNLQFNPQANRGNQLQAVIVKALVPCDASTFTIVGVCESAAITNFSITAPALLPSSDYYVILNGATNGGATLPAEATFDLLASGPGIDRLPVQMSIGGPSGIVCPQSVTSFTTYLNNCTDTSVFRWYVDGILTATTTNSLWQTSEIVNGNIVSVSCSCFDVCPETVTYALPPVVVDSLFVNAGADQTIQIGQEVQLNGTSNGTSFSWSPSATISSQFSLSTFATPSSTTSYFLTATNENCALTDEVIVFISDQLTIPGSFSPNGDGVNDTWQIDGISFYPNTQVTIYDRWGQNITDIVGYSAVKSWDGTKKGNPVTDGVYFYVIDLNDGSNSKILKGNVTIIR